MKSLLPLKKLTLLMLIAGLSIISSCNEPASISSNNPEIDELQGVLINEFNEPVPNAVMELVQVASGKVAVQSEDVIERDTTDEDGNYHFKKVPADLSTVDLVISHSDLQPYRINLGEMLKGKDIKRVIIQAKYKEDCCGQISIKVFSANDSSAINDASVKLYIDKELKRKVMTGDDGTHTFYEVCKGEYWLKINKENYKTSIVENVLIKGCDEQDYVNLSIFLQQNNENDSCCQGTLKVIPKDKNTGEVIKGALIKLRQSREILQKKENKGDYVLFENVCEGEYEVVIIKDGYNAQEIQVLMDCNEEKEITVEMEKKECCDGVMTVKVQDKDNNAITKAEVRLWLNGSKVKVGATNSDGLISFTGLCEGKYGVDIAKTGYESIEFSQELGCNDSVEVVKALTLSEQDSCCDGWVEVIVRDSTGNGVEYAKVILWKSRKVVEDGKTNANGSISFAGLCEGEYGVTIKRDGYETMEFEFNLDCNERKVLEKVLQKESQDSCCNGKVILNVEDEDNNALKLVVVALWKGNKKVGLAKTNTDGQIVFENLCEGEYQISMSKDGYQGVEFDFLLGCDETKEFTKNLTKKDSCCTAIMKLIIVNEDKEAIDGARVEVYFDGGIIEDGESDSDGHWIMDGLCAPATYTVVVKKDGYETQEFKMEYTECKAMSKKVIMKK